MDGKDIFAKTIWAEARGESLEGQKEVARVIRERAAQNKSYWGGSKIEDVCRKPNQFSCWNGVTDIDVSKDERSYLQIRSWSDSLYDEPLEKDSDAPDHYLNPNAAGSPAWTKNCDKKYKIGKHQFYRSK